MSRVRALPERSFSVRCAPTTPAKGREGGGSIKVIHHVYPKGQSEGLTLVVHSQTHTGNARVSLVGMLNVRPT